MDEAFNNIIYQQDSFMDDEIKYKTLFMIIKYLYCNGKESHY